MVFHTQKFRGNYAQTKRLSFQYLAVTLNLRITPDLRFVKDGSIEHGARIAKALEEIKINDEKLKKSEAKDEENG